MILGYDTLNLPNTDALDPEITLKDIGVTLTKQDLVDAGGKVEPDEPTYEEVTSIEDLSNLINGDEPKVYAEITEDLSLTASKKIDVPAGKEVYIKLDSTLSCAKVGFDVADGGTLTLSGEGTIQTSNKGTSGAMVQADGANAVVNIEGITLDAITVNGKVNNYAYGIYLLNDASVNFKSGTVKCAYGSCISTNNTTGGATVINVEGGELLCDGSYAIYLPSQATVNIKGNAKVQGINARMGKFNIEENAQILPTTITEADYDNIGSNFSTSGCVWLGDTIAVMAGTYTDVDGTECIFDIKDNATVTSNFRSAIGIYEVDTKEAQVVTFNVANAANVTTTAQGFENITVYNHDYIAEQAQAAGKTYEPTVQSDVTVNVA